MSTQSINFSGTNLPVPGNDVDAENVNDTLVALINDYNLQIGSNKIAAGAIGNTQLADNAVETANIAAQAVGNTQVNYETQSTADDGSSVSYGVSGNQVVDLLSLTTGEASGLLIIIGHSQVNMGGDAPDYRFGLGISIDGTVVRETFQTKLNPEGTTGNAPEMTVAYMGTVGGGQTHTIQLYGEIIDGGSGAFSWDILSYVFLKDT